ncbi:MAG: hypothetical protein MI976_11445 [Pseudomonadales bacterium]|nr:hypothetical protein [Pseudomonadales bacterium]
MSDNNRNEYERQREELERREIERREREQRESIIERKDYRDSYQPTENELDDNNPPDD